MALKWTTEHLNNHDILFLHGFNAICKLLLMTESAKIKTTPGNKIDRTNCNNLLMIDDNQHYNQDGTLQILISLTLLP